MITRMITVIIKAFTVITGCLVRVIRVIKAFTGIRDNYRVISLSPIYIYIFIYNNG